MWMDDKDYDDIRLCECTLRHMLEDKSEDDAFKLLTIINNYILDVRREQREIERRLTGGRFAK